MKTFKSFRDQLLEDGVAIANSVGTTDKASVAGEPIKKAGIKTMRRNNRPWTSQNRKKPSEATKAKNFARERDDVEFQ